MKSLRYITILSLALLMFIPITSHALNAVSIKKDEHMYVALIEDHSQPMVAVSIALPDLGYAYDPEDKQGLAKIVASMLSEGAGPYDATAFKQLLEKHAITLNFSADRENFYIHIRCLTKDIELAMDLLQHSLQSPHIDPKNLKHIKDQMQFSLLKYKESPAYIAKKNWKKAVFGNHPYSRLSLGTKDSIESITVDDVKNYISNTLYSSYLIAGFVGDVSYDRTEDLVNRYFAPIFMERDVTVKPLTGIGNVEGNTVTIIQERPQSVAYFGFKAVDRFSEDFIPLYVLNHIFGGSDFESYLTKTLREDKGLTYSAYSTLDATETYGFIKGTVATKGEDIITSVEVIKQQMDRIYTDGVTEEELVSAKKYLIGSYPLQFDDSSSLADYLVYVQHYKLGLDYFDNRSVQIEAVTLDDIKRVAKTYFSSDNLVTVIVGDL